MTFEEFSKWSNERACDGKWGMREAMICSGICGDIYAQKSLFFSKKKREQAWQNHPKRELAEKIVVETNRIIREVEERNAEE